MLSETPKPPHWEAKTKDGKILIRTKTGYDNKGKPIIEDIWVTDEEIQTLKEKNQEFDIIMAPSGGIDTIA